MMCVVCWSYMPFTQGLQPASNWFLPLWQERHASIKDSGSIRVVVGVCVNVVISEWALTSLYIGVFGRKANRFRKTNMNVRYVERSHIHLQPE